MKKIFTLFTLSLWGLMCFGQTPLSQNGRLKLVGKQLSNQCGSAVQLRGMSSHAVQPHKNCITPAAIASLASSWKSDVIRLAVAAHTQPGGRTPSPELWQWTQ